MLRFRKAALAAFAALLAAACGLSLSGTGSGNASPTDDAGGPESSTADVTRSDVTSTDGASDAADGGNPIADASGCPDANAPAMVNVGAFCIDSTEVSFTEYGIFITANVKAPPAVPGCDWKTSYT